MEDVTSMNSVLKGWFGHNDSPVNKTKIAEVSRCSVVYKFFTVFKLRCNKLDEKAKAQLTVVSNGFIEWIRKFVQKNRIFFPHVDTLFQRIIYCIIPVSAECCYKSQEDYDDSDSCYLSRIKGALEEAIIKDKPDKDKDKSLASSHGSTDEEEDIKFFQNVISTNCS